MDKHTLYIVATPIGHLSDITLRALRVLRDVDTLYTEDTRTSHTLLAHHGITRRCVSLHEHNEAQRSDSIVEQLGAGESAALISDAGTPLISDPGYRLVSACHAAGLRVSPIPGPSALTAALSVAGLPTDRFLFAGFPPARAAARRSWLEPLTAQPHTLVIYESCHRLLDTLTLLVDLCGGQRQACMSRELTKRYETVVHAPLQELLDTISVDANQRRGELVLIIQGAEATRVIPPELERMLRALLPQMPIKQVATLAADVFGLPKREVYRCALALQRKAPEPP